MIFIQKVFLFEMLKEVIFFRIDCHTFENEKKRFASELIPTKIKSNKKQLFNEYKSSS